MIKVSNTSPQVLSPTASDPIHKEVREARVANDGTILPSLKHANDYDYNQLDDKIDALSATSSTSLSVLQGAVDTLDTRLDVAEPKITTLQSESTSYKSRLDTAEPKITTLQSEMATEKPNIASLQSDMTAEKAKIVTLQADNTTNKANIATLQSGKADKVQEAWITPTLTNGATGTIQYRKNSTGRIEFRGNVSISTSNPCAVLPVGYRPLDTIRVMQYVSPTVYSVITINTGGGLYVGTTNMAHEMVLMSYPV